MFNIISNNTDKLHSHNFLLVVIVNYRVPNLTIDCLNSLASEVQALSGTKVIVVDNDSNDQSVEQIQAAIEQNGWENWASVIPSNHNGGYSFGNNFAIRPALKDSQPPSYFFILNPDTQLRDGALKTLVNFMENNPNVGITGPSIEINQGKLWSKTYRFPSLLSEFDSGLRLGIVSKILSNWVIARQMTNEQSQVDWLPGTAMMVRREVFESVGLMDEGYFLFYEETDLCLQAQKAGWSSWYVPQARIMDLGGQSRKKADSSDSKRKPQYWFESRRRYFLKNHGWLYAALADVMRSFGFILWRIRRLIQGKPDQDPPMFLWDFIRNSVLFNFK